MAGKDGCSSSSREKNLSFLGFFTLIRLSVHWTKSICVGEDNILYSVYRFKYWCFLETVKNILRNNILLAIWLTLSLVELSYKINHHMGNVCIYHAGFPECLTFAVDVINQFLKGLSCFVYFFCSIFFFSFPFGQPNYMLGSIMFYYRFLALFQPF